TQYNEGGYALNMQPVTGDNLLLYSEQADNAYWAVGGGDTVSADATTAPDGSATADGLVASNANATHLISTAAGESFTLGSDYTFSTYVKAGDRDNTRIAFNGAAFGGAVGAEFDLVTGTVTNTDAGVSSASIEGAGNGW